MQDKTGTTNQPTDKSKDVLTNGPTNRDKRPHIEMLADIRHQFIVSAFNKGVICKRNDVFKSNLGNDLTFSRHSLVL